MAKNDTASLLEGSRKALDQLGEEIAGLEATRNQRLLANEPATKIGAIDRELENSRRSAGIERDRIKLFEDQIKREKEEARLAGKLQQIQQVEELFQARDAAGMEAIQAIAALDAAYRKLFTLAREIRDSWNFRMVDAAPVLISETAIEQAIAAELWRTCGRAVQTGGGLPNPDGGSLPGVKAPTLQALGQPSLVEPFAAVLKRGSELASQIMRLGKSTGPIEGKAAKQVGSSGRSLPQLLQRMNELADCAQTPEVEAEYQSIVQELSAIPQDEAA
jgi:hypothetical protein